MYRCGRACQKPCGAFKSFISSSKKSAIQNAILTNLSKHRVQLCRNSSRFSQQINPTKYKSLFYLTGGTLCIGLYFANNHFVNAAKKVQVDRDSANQNVDDKEVKETAALKLPTSAQYLLIGGGTASFSALRAIRKKEPAAKILIITAEDYNPYMRPPLSKELWFSDSKEDARNLTFKQWNGKMRNIFFQKESFFTDPSEFDSAPEGSVSVIKGRKVMAIEPEDNVVVLDDGSRIEFSKCLVATGGTPKTIPSIRNASQDVKSRITLFRGAKDFLELDEITDTVGSVTIIGGGFLGSELACALGHKASKSELKVNQVFPEKGNMGRVLPEYLTKWTTKKVSSEGVNVVADALVQSITNEDGKIKLSMSDGNSIKTDHVVVAVGLDIDTSLAESAGMEVDETHGGYRVNAELQGRNNIWVAGDAACFYDMKLGRRRVEHHDHAVVSGRLAGENMTGAGKPYWHQSMFWSDLGPEVGYEAIGIVDSSLPTVGVFAKATERDTPRAAAMESGEGIRSEVQEDAVDQQQPDVPTPASSSSGKDEFGKGVVFYLRNEKVVGVLLWNIFGRMPLARKLIRDQQSYEDYGELAKMFKIYSESMDEEDD